MDPWSTPWADIRRTFCDPDNTNFVVDVNLFARSEHEMEDSILECDDPLPGTLPTAPIVDSSNAYPADDSAETTFKENEGTEDASGEQPTESTVGLEASLQMMNNTRKAIKVEVTPKFFETKVDQIKYYDSHDVETEPGRRKWQSETIRMLLSIIRPTNRNDAVPADQFIGPEAEGVLHQAHQAAHHSAEGNLGVSSVMSPHYFQMIFNQNFTNLQHRLHGNTLSYKMHLAEHLHDRVHLSTSCLDLLLCDSVPTTSRYQSKLLGTSTKCEFFAFQINGAVGLLLKLIGRIDPLALLKWAKIPHQSAEGQRVISAAGKLKHLTLHAAICADLTGFGKTKLVLLAVQLYSILTEFNKPSLLIVPSALVSQWAAEIQTYWPYFRPILSYGGESGWESHFDTIKSKEMESKSWPVSLAAIMSGSDPMAKSAVILTSYDTHIRRTAYTEQVQVPGVPFAKPRFHEDGSPKWKKRPRVQTLWKTTHQGVFGLLLADEAHKVKNQRSGIWAVLYQQQYQTILLATATPMYNSTQVRLSPKPRFWNRC
jgi:hypothetical protein